MGHEHRRRPSAEADAEVTVAWKPRMVAQRRTIAFNADCSIHVMNADGSRQRRLPAKVDCAIDPAWSPDGRKIAFSQNPLDPFGHIWVMNADGSEPRRLTRYRMQDFAPAWSPNGRRIAFARDPTQPGDPDHPGGALYIFVMDADGGFQRQLTWFGNEYDPAWSPDGRRIAFASGRGGSNDIYVMNADGSGERSLTRHPADDRLPAWSAGP